jgi:3-phosphoshikimate 1-carboxyvinyltransferase
MAAAHLGATNAVFKASPSGPLHGRAHPPGDKSISHRAMILGGLAQGVTEVEGLLEGDDVLRTAAAVEAFGAKVERLGEGRWRVEGRGGFQAPKDVVDCGNSGTGVRLLMGAAAGFELQARFDGDASLRKRPMGRVTGPLLDMGARFETAEGGRLPLTLVGGGLKGITYRLPVASAQVKSAVLLAGLNAAGETVVIEPEPTRDHTERMLKAFGADIEAGPVDGVRTIRVRPRPLRAAHVAVPGDPSSAAFPLVAALLVQGSEIRLDGVLLNPLRTGLIDTLREMGADIETVDAREAGGEPVGDLIVRASALKGVEVPRERAPSMIDEYPILAVAAAFAQGTTVMRGIGELRVKESDRIALMAAGLGACGVEVEEEPDGLIVHGCGRPPRGGAQVRTAGDHRIAMSHLVLGLAAERGVVVDEPGMIATSFPGFGDLMRGLGAEIVEEG